MMAIPESAGYLWDGTETCGFLRVWDLLSREIHILCLENLHVIEILVYTVCKI